MCTKQLGFKQAFIRPAVLTCTNVCFSEIPLCLYETIKEKMNKNWILILLKLTSLDFQSILWWPPLSHFFALNPSGNSRFSLKFSPRNSNYFCSTPLKISLIFSTGGVSIFLEKPNNNTNLRFPRSFRGFQFDSKLLYIFFCWDFFWFASYDWSCLAYTYRMNDIDRMR